MALAHAGALCLGGVCGEDRLDTRLAEGQGDFRLAPSLGLHRGEGVRPETALRFGTKDAFALAPRVVGDLFLNHVEELESDRIDLSGFARIIGDSRGTSARLEPGQGLGELRLRRRAEDGAETLHDLGHLAIEGFESGVDEFGVARSGREVFRHAGKWAQKLRTGKGSKIFAVRNLSPAPPWP